MGRKEVEAVAIDNFSQHVQSVEDGCGVESEGKFFFLMITILNMFIC